MISDLFFMTTVEDHTKWCGSTEYVNTWKVSFSFRYIRRERNLSLLDSNFIRTVNGQPLFSKLQRLQDNPLPFKTFNLYNLYWKIIKLNIRSWENISSVWRFITFQTTVRPLIDHKRKSYYGLISIVCPRGL